LFSRQSRVTVLGEEPVATNVGVHRDVGDGEMFLLMGSSFERWRLFFWQSYLGIVRKLTNRPTD
jgi:hypothetical protein